LKNLLTLGSQDLITEITIVDIRTTSTIKTLRPIL
jgi:hypothetical protein